MQEDLIGRVALPENLALERRKKVISFLKAASTLETGKLLHRVAIESGDVSHLHVASTLISMYVKCGSMHHAREVFDSLEHPDVVCWNAIILGYASNGEGMVAMEMFCGMRREGLAPVERSFVAAFKACSDLAGREILECRKYGRVLHLLATRNGCDRDIFVQSSMVDMYAKFGNMEMARKVFDCMGSRNVVAWTALMLGYADNGDGQTTLDLFQRMVREGFELNTRTFVAALKACTGLAEDDLSYRERGKAVYLMASMYGADLDIYVQTTLINMYSKFGSMENARKVFDGMKLHNVVSWNAMVLGYAENRMGEKALCLFREMRHGGLAPDARSFLAALKACRNIELENTKQVGKALHLLSSRNGCDADIYVQSSLVDVYAKCGTMDDAKYVFSSMENANVVSWNTPMMGYAENGEGAVSLDLLLQMECPPDARTFVASLKASMDLSARECRLKAGKQLHLIAAENGCDSDLYVQSTLVDLYAKCGSMIDAQKVFDKVGDPDVVCRTSLMLGYAEIGEGWMGLELFSRMRTEGCALDARTFVAVLKSCTDIAMREKDEAAKRAKQVYLLALQTGNVDIHVEASLVDMYAKAGCMDNARHVFDHMKNHNVVSWTSLILGYAENGAGKTSLDLFSQMKKEGFSPDAFTFSAVIKACTALGALETGKKFHAEIVCSRFKDNPAIATCLMEFYCKTGSLNEALQVFDSHHKRDVKTWNTLMAGYSFQGDINRVFGLFERMQNTNVKPDAITFKCMLTACSHAGLVENGIDLFVYMSTKYGVQPGLDHYTCLIDMLSRSERLNEAIEMLRSMPFTPSGVIWMSVLGACWKLKNLELGKLAFQSLVGLEDDNAAAYVVMSNMYQTKQRTLVVR